MELLPLKVLATRGAWRKYYARRSSKKFQSIQEKVWERDNYTCRYCGFQAKEYQDVVNKDQDYDNNSGTNLVTACTFCTQCFFLDSVGLDDRFGGRVIYLPEITQIDLNNFCRVLFCSMDKDSAYKGKLQAVYLSLKDRGKAVETCFGPGASNPAVFGQGLIDIYLDKNINQTVLSNLRLLPSRQQFRPQIEYWKKTVFANVPL